MSTGDSTDPTSPAFAPFNKNDHGAVVIVASYIFLIISLLAIIVKLWTRWQTTRKLIWNDYLMSTAAVSCKHIIYALTHENSCMQ